MSIKDDIDGLGSELLSAARAKPKKGEEPMHSREKVDIFKAVSAWYLGSTKMKPSDEENDITPRPGSFDTIRQRVNGGQRP